MKISPANPALSAPPVHRPAAAKDADGDRDGTSAAAARPSAATTAATATAVAAAGKVDTYA